MCVCLILIIYFFFILSIGYRERERDVGFDYIYCCLREALESARDYGLSRARAAVLITLSRREDGTV